MTTTLLLMFVALLALVWSAFCSGTETGLLSVSRARILHLAHAGGRRAKKVQAVLKDLGRATTTILIGNNIANVTYSTATAALISRLLADHATAAGVCSFLAAFTVLYTSEFMPKLLCAARPLRRILVLIGPYEVMAKILAPLTAIAMFLTNLFVPRRETREKLTANDLLRILQDRKDGVVLSEFESALISRLVVLRAKGQPITPEAILSALREEEGKEHVNDARGFIEA